MVVGFIFNQIDLRRQRDSLGKLLCNVICCVSKASKVLHYIT
jgi:hypothetical protein